MNSPPRPASPSYSHILVSDAPDRTLTQSHASQSQRYTYPVEPSRSSHTREPSATGLNPVSKFQPHHHHHHHASLEFDDELIEDHSHIPALPEEHSVNPSPAPTLTSALPSASASPPASQPSSRAGTQLLHPSQDRSDTADLTVTDAPLHFAGVSSTAPKSSINSSVFVLAATTLGAGILALPFAFAQLGWLFGAILLTAIGITTSYAIYLLLYTAQCVGARTYEDLGACIFPRHRGKQLVVTTTLILIFGSLTAFFVIIADTVTPALQSIAGASHADSFFLRRETLLVILGVCVIFPLCWLRSIHALERWSVLAVGIIFAFAILVVVDAIRALANGTAAPGQDGTHPDFDANIHPAYFDAAMFEALPIICLAFTCQSMLFPIWNSLELPPSAPLTTTDLMIASDGSASTTGIDIHTYGGLGGAASALLAPLSSITSVANRSLLLCGALYLPVGVLGFFLFGRSTCDDVLSNFPKHSAFYDVVRVLFTFAIVLHYPIVHFGFRSAVLTTWYADKTEEENRVRWWIITCSVCLCSLVLAILLPSLSAVFGLTGAVCAFPYCFVFPSLFYLRLHTPGTGVVMCRPVGVVGGNAEDSISVPTTIHTTSDGVVYSPVASTETGSASYPSPSPPPDSRRTIGGTIIEDVSLGGVKRTQQQQQQTHASPSTPSSLPSAIQVTASPPSPLTNTSPLLHGAQLSSSTSTFALPESALPDFESAVPPRALTRRERWLAYTLLGAACVLWVTSIVVCFKGMIETLAKEKTNSSVCN